MRSSVDLRCYRGWLEEYLSFVAHASSSKNQRSEKAVDKTVKSLEVKLRGRPEAPNWSRGCTLSSRARGDTTDYHGPLQRSLGVGVNWHVFRFKLTSGIPAKGAAR
jgi:hypothetical protein